MQTLYERLKPEYKQRLEDQRDDYPTLIKGIQIALKDNYFWSHLTIGQAKDLITFTDNSFGDISTNEWVWGDKFFLPIPD